MASAHAEFKVALDTTQAQRDERKLEQLMDKFASSAERASARADRAIGSSMGGGGASSSAARMGAKGGRAGGWQMGAVMMQVQDIGVQMQMGASASRIIAQQGSQIASFFGPTGMIVGGLITIGALMWDWANGTAAQEKRLENLGKQLEKQRADSRKIVSDFADDEIAIEAAKAKLRGGDPEQMKREREFEKKINDIESSSLSPEARTTALDQAYERAALEQKVRDMERKIKSSVTAGAVTMATAASIRKTPQQRAAERQEAIDQKQAERRAIEREIRKENKEAIQKGTFTEAERRRQRIEKAQKLVLAKQEKNGVSITPESIKQLTDEIGKLITK